MLMRATRLVQVLSLHNGFAQHVCTTCLHNSLHNGFVQHVYLAPRCVWFLFQNMVNHCVNHFSVLDYFETPSKSSIILVCDHFSVIKNFRRLWRRSIILVCNHSSVNLLYRYGEIVNGVSIK